jgi:GTP-binding protein
LKTEPGTKIFPFSALSKQGREEIWDCIEAVMENHNEENQVNVEEITDSIE